MNIFLVTGYGAGDRTMLSRRSETTRLFRPVSPECDKNSSRNIPGSSGGTSLSPSPVEQVNDVVIYFCQRPIGSRKTSMQMGFNSEIKKTVFLLLKAWTRFASEEWNSDFKF